ncbi:MAG: TIGR03087 family PEP-CTERM/XrtA system glycosyltransferase [Gammaproteobacteria bacterium]|nr:TIGR03087 family PEP-CTERM/XrtA system glycosyltransferase [Gammaproteobacteria bacterium]
MLFLAHRIPYPPNKGDKIRSFNLLRHLAGYFHIHLGAFVDDPHDWRYRDEVSAYCATLCLVPLKPRWAKLRSLRGLLTGEALTVPYYRDRRMRAWVRKTTRAGPMRTLVFSSAMAQYLPTQPAARAATRPQVVDFVDVDSDKWRQYAQRRRFPMSWIYRRESRTLLQFERAVAAQASASVLVSQHEVDLFCQLTQTPREQVHAIDNGVDTAYFSPEADLPNPYPAETRALVFTGAMDYWANVDAVVFFAEQVFPRIRAALPEARFYIVGARPLPEVCALGEQLGITVTGAVPDIRPYLAHAMGAVAPLRIARGVQNKVLEALAMGCPVVVTPQALDGLRPDAGSDWLVAEAVEELAQLSLRLLQGTERATRGAQGRDYVLRHYSWSEHLDQLLPLLRAVPGATGGEQ